MPIARWIGGFLGFITTGSILGALAGYALGALFEQGLDSVNAGDSGYNNREYDDNDIYSRYQQYRQQATEGQRNSFLFSMLVLATYIIRADGRVMHSEMELLRNFLRQNFGNQAVSQGEQIALKLFERQKAEGARYKTTIRGACQQIAANMDYSSRLQLLSFLVAIAQADGTVANSEITALREVAAHLGIAAADVDSMLSMRDASTSLEAAYKVLGISPSATDEEVKAAYRKMALQHHPDKVAQLGDDIKQAAQKKFQEINAAKEKIYKARGL